MELFTYICIKMKVMEAKAKFDVVLSPEASDFLNGLGSKIRDKIVYNIRKSTYIIDPKLFKKLDDTDIWEFRTRHSNTQYRLLAFWDKTSDMDTLVIALSNKGEKALRGEIKAVWEREFKLKSNSYRPSDKKEGAINDDQWRDEVGRVSVNVPVGTRFWKGIMSCQFPERRLEPKHGGIGYASPIIHLYWKAEGSGEWVLLRCDADYLFNRNYGEGYIWDETTNFIRIMPQSWQQK